MNKKKFIALGAAFGLAATLLAGAPAANAEPVADYAAVGSDTLQDVLNGLANGSTISGGSVRSMANDSPMASFDATGSALIQTKVNGPRFVRPNGSGNGVSALSRSIDGNPWQGTTITGQVDIARSSSGAGSLANPTSGRLNYIPFGRDALAYAHTAGANAAFDNISVAALKALFECTATTIGGVTAVPVIPQTGSGSRTDFLSKIGVADADLGPCVLVGQEHDTKFLANGTTAFPANAVTPMSAAQWVAQNTGAGIDRRGATAKIGSPIAGVSPVTGTGTAMAPNPAYYSDGLWGRDTYIVVEYARITPGDALYDAKLANLVSNGGQKLANNGSLSSQAGAVKKKYGFLAPSTTIPTRANLRS